MYTLSDRFEWVLIIAESIRAIVDGFNSWHSPKHRPFAPGNNRKSNFEKQDFVITYHRCREITRVRYELCGSEIHSWYIRRVEQRHKYQWSVIFHSFLWIFYKYPNILFRKFDRSNKNLFEVDREVARIARVSLWQMSIQSLRLKPVVECIGEVNVEVQSANRSSQFRWGHFLFWILFLQNERLIETTNSPSDSINMWINSWRHCRAYSRANVSNSTWIESCKARTKMCSCARVNFNDLHNDGSNKLQCNRSDPHNLSKRDIQASSHNP
jgi:hypothetical protein